MNIKFPRRISEEEFLLHLKTLAPNEIAQNFIISFYQRLKQFDAEHGKHLSAHSFGFRPSAYHGIYDFCDHAKTLFLSEKAQKDLQKSLSEYAEKAETLKQGDQKRKEYAKNYIAKVEEVFANTLPPIGYEELFRFQFVNFVEEIEFSAKDDENNGMYDPKICKLILCQVLDDKSEINSESFWKQNIVAWHELVHLMQLKSCDNGTRKYLTPFYIEQISDDAMIMPPDLANVKVLENGKIVFDEYIIEVFKKGNWLLNEVLTEMFTLHLWQKNQPVILKENNYEFESSPIFSNVFSDEQNKFELNTGYLKFSCIFECFNCLTFKHQNQISNPNFPPTWSYIENLKDFFDDAQISPNVLKSLNQNLAEIGVTETSPNFMLEKFVLLLGRAAIEKETKNPFNAHTILAQTLLVDIGFNRLKRIISQDNLNLQNSSFDKKTSQNLIQLVLNRGFVLKYWLCFPNINVGTKEDPIWAKRTLSAAEFSDLCPENHLAKLFAAAVNEIKNYSNKVCPKFVSDNKYFEKVEEYLKPKE